MGLTDEIEERAENLGAKAETLGEIKEEVKELRGQVEEVSEEIDQTLGEEISKTEELLGKMIELLRSALKSMEVMEETRSIMNAVRELGNEAEEAREEISSVKWSKRVRTTVWQGVALGIALLLATSILWTSTTLPQVLTPKSLVLSEKEEQALELGNRFRRSFRGLGSDQQEEVTALLKAGLQAQEAKENPNDQSSSQSSSAQGSSQSGSSR